LFIPEKENGVGLGANSKSNACIPANLTGIVAGFMAVTVVVKALIHREGGTFHGR
jgi:hypothetical protein